MKKLFNKINAKKRYLTGAGIALVFSGASHAALPTVATDAFTVIQGYIADLETAAWPILVTTTVAFILIKLFKRFSRSAT